MLVARRSAHDYDCAIKTPYVTPIFITGVIHINCVCALCILFLLDDVEWSWVIKNQRIVLFFSICFYPIFLDFLLKKGRRVLGSNTIIVSVVFGIRNSEVVYPGLVAGTCNKSNDVRKRPYGYIYAPVLFDISTCSLIKLSYGIVGATSETTKIRGSG